MPGEDRDERPSIEKPHIRYGAKNVTQQRRARRLGQEPMPRTVLSAPVTPGHRPDWVGANLEHVTAGERR
jgi:hypothetical protein